MRKFSEDQKDLYYLSPYTTIKVMKDAVLINQRLFNTLESLQISQSAAIPLLDGLNAGITEIQLIELLLKDGNVEEPEILIKNWIQKGILE